MSIFPVRMWLLFCCDLVDGRFLMSREKLMLPSGEKKIRFTPHAKVLFTNDSRTEDLFMNDKHESKSEEIESPKKDYPSLFSFLYLELTRGYVLEHDEERYSARREKMYSFMKIPREIEKFMSYGFMQCTDSFLFVYTSLPIRVILALVALITRPIAICLGLQKRRYKSILLPAEVCDLLKAIILIICSMFMFYIDTNMLYHMIKSQSVIKLYIFYNMLEVGDRLFSTFGQDTIDALFWTATEPRDKKRGRLGIISHLMFATVYVFLHSFLVLLQATTLNVAINSNNKALLTIMMSNNFVELKGSVFKKFDKNNLFQVSCSDVRERFHLVILLFIVVLQTMKEYSWKFDRFWMLLPDCLMVLLAEIFVDWVKHACITHFNELQVDVYRDYTTSLAYDVAQTRQKHAFTDHSDLVARRMGFIPLPLGVVMIRILALAIYIGDLPSLFILIIAYLGLASYRLLNNILILGIACSLINLHKQEKATVHSPSRAGSPLTVPANKSNVTKDWVKDTATSPLKPVQDSPVTFPIVNVNGINNSETSAKSVSSDLATDCRITDLGSTAIFSNSTIDLKNVTLNEELLKVEGEDIKIEPVVEDHCTRSDPNIKCEYSENTGEREYDNIENLIKKRAESEPNLVNCNEEDDLVL